VERFRQPAHNSEGSTIGSGEVGPGVGVGCGVGDGGGVGVGSGGGWTLICLILTSEPRGPVTLNLTA
jgi:hypothetical protein